MALAYDDELYLRNSLSDFGTPTGETALRYQQDFFTGNGSTTLFILSETPDSTYPVYLYLAGVLQTAEQVTIVSQNVTFASAPPNTSIIVAIYEY
jgi:hypothetical protein